MSVGFDVALSALNAARRGIGVAGHNLANAATRGFSRQRVLVTQAAPEYVRPGLSVGRGVEISGVDRVVDDFLAARLRDQRSQFGVAIVRRDLHREAEAAFGEPGENGLNARLGAFFEEIRGLAYQPGDAAAQAGMIQRTGDLAQAFRGVRAAVVAVRRSAADSVVAESRNVNGVLAQIARLNDSVTAAGYGTNLPPDVQDRFESLFDELSGLIDVRVSKTPSGRYLVASSGVALVDSSGYRALDAIRGQTETDPTVIRLRGTTLEFKPKSGSLRGALDLDADLTGERLNVLDGVAKSLIRSVNHAHATGVPPSGGFTRLVAERAFKDKDGDGSILTEPLKNQALPFPIDRGLLTVNVQDATGRVRQSRVVIDGATQTVGQLVASLNAVPGLNAVLDGAGRLRIAADPGSKFDFSTRVPDLPDSTGAFGVDVVAGGRYTGTQETEFVLKPESAGIVGETPGLRVRVERPDGAVLGFLDVGAGYSPKSEIDLAEGITVAFAAGSIDPSTSGPVKISGLVDGDTSGVLAALGVNGLFTGVDASDIALSSSIENDPSKLAAGLGGGDADGANLDRLLAAESTSDASLGGLSIAGRFSLLVAEAGYEASRAVDAAAVQELMIESLESRRAEISGVDTDEELLRLEEYQRAFEAAARLTRTIAEVTDILIRIGE